MNAGIGLLPLERRGFLHAALGGALAARAHTQEPPPNIVFIYADDLGYGDLGCYGSSIPTPNLDRMATEGMRFTQWTSASSVCSPSRASLLTGRYPTRVGIPWVLKSDEPGLPASETTLAQALKGRGYRTACVGKWHLGRTAEYLPTAHGFDSYFGLPYSNDMRPSVLIRGTDVVERPVRLDTLTRRYTDEALAFIDSSKKVPFFLYFSHTFPHIPLAASDRFRGRSGLGLYGDATAELDWSVGEILAKLKRERLDRKTLVMFSSDNGPWYQGSAGNLRGRKGSNWEGGLRVPFLARWPGRIPAGRTNSALCSMLDVFPTVAALAQAPPPEKALDGIDIWPLLSGRQTDFERDPLLYFDSWDLQCARWRSWKLHLARLNVERWNPVPSGGSVNIRLSNPELYDLSKDPGESYNVATAHPEVVARLTQFIERQMSAFPPEVRDAWTRTALRRSAERPEGATPRVASEER